MGNAAGLKEFAKYAVALKFVPGVAENADIDGYQVETNVCNYAVFNINNGYEVSFKLDKDTKQRVGFADLNAWKGSTAAKKRLKNRCGPVKPRALPTWYQSCGNGGGMHLWSSTCQWDWKDDHAQDIEIWLGFDPNLAQYCGDGMVNMYMIFNFLYIFNVVYSQGGVPLFKIYQFFIFCE